MLPKTPERAFLVGGQAVGREVWPVAGAVRPAVMYATTVAVSWTNVSAAATNYVVARSDDAGTNYNIVATLGANVTMPFPSGAEGVKVRPAQAVPMIPAAPGSTEKTPGSAAAGTTYEPMPTAPL